METAVMWELCTKICWERAAALVDGMGLTGACLSGFLALGSQSKNDESAHCPACGEKVESAFLRCPGCGFQLQRNCPGCGKIVKTNWDSCPHCETDFHPRSMSGRDNEKDKQPKWRVTK